MGRVIIALSIMLVVGAFDGAGEQDYLRSFIPVTCCVTNRCCWQIGERELTPLADDRWLVNSTGQVVPRTGWSPDGRFYRCACDYDPSQGAWIRHQGAHTRCIFVPMRIGWAR
jgi:hypothetical protein